ncbi:hypothetical protein [Brevibacterium luteolum]|uniref:hypothetical protein n=1 Tax=Brevibacterium luteolum TaxID=199591 RepID=UPI00223AF035|nr:hypothetical protein [Brevibacterium luteolum]MCT1658211.1 hypothetical protein [Brevibacterium luteolum]MCT1920929.1 hypothetical protein [Brevibacterium luteolum]
MSAEITPAQLGNEGAKGAAAVKGATGEAPVKRGKRKPVKRACGREACPREATRKIKRNGAVEWFCGSHIRTEEREKYGRCSFRDGVTGKQCEVRRYTKTSGKSRKQNGYCRVHERQYLDDMNKMTLMARIAEFHSHVETDALTGCWYWTLEGCETRERGSFKVGGITWYPYRFAYLVYRGAHGNGRVLNHTCGRGNPTAGRGTCVNPFHLEPVTYGYNNTYEPCLAYQNDVVTRTAFENQGATMMMHILGLPFGIGY